MGGVITKNIYTSKAKVKLLDLFFDTVYEIEERKAQSLSAKYPSRYIIQNNQKEKNIMPAMPKPYKPLPNGICTLVTLNSEEHKGKFGLQEKISCVVEAPPNWEGAQYVYIPHNSYKKVTGAISAGIAQENEQTGEWSVLEGVRFRVVVQDGKIVSLMPHENVNELIDHAANLAS